MTVASVEGHMHGSIDDLSPAAIRAAVAEQYGRVTHTDAGTLPFPVGRAFAESVGYPPELLDRLPSGAVDAFAGISYPLRHALLQAGEEVLDLGCGAGMDTLIAAAQVGPSGHVHAVDLSQEMLERAAANAAAAGAGNAVFHLAPAEEIPLGNGVVDAVIVNGIFNLCPAKEPVMAEVCRVLRPGGRLLVSEIVIRDPEGGAEGSAAAGPGDGAPGRTLENWFQWLSGALPERSFLQMIRESGLQDPVVLARSRNARTNNPQVLVADMRAFKPGGR